MYLNHKSLLLFIAICSLCGCATQTGFLGFGPLDDKKEYVHARDLFNNGQYQEAVTSLTEYIYKTKNVKRREVRAYRLLGQSYENIGKLDKALEVYQEALEFHPQDIPLLLAAADLYKRTNLNEQAAELYQRVLAVEPANQQALAGMAENYINMGFYSEARMYYDQYFKLDPSAHSKNRARYALTFLRQRDYKNAVINITMALSENDRNPDFWFLSAKANLGLGRPQDAMDDLDIALFLAPGRRDLIVTKALWLYHAKQFDSSLQLADEILAKTPDNALALFIRYLNLNATQRPTQAKQLLEKIVKLPQESFTQTIAQQLLLPPDSGAR